MPPGAKPKDETQQSFFESLYAALDADANEILDGLFLGAAKAASDRKAMQQRKISHVLIAHPTMKEQHPQHFKYGRAPLIDIPSFNLLEKLPDALSFLREARSKGGKVFVYCAKGISRSSSLVIALLMLEQGIGFDEAWDICEKKRPIVYPNVGFQQQLRHLEEIMKTSIDIKAPWKDQVKQLKKVLPTGDLEGPKSPLPIRDRIGSCMGDALVALEALVDKVMTQPQLLQKRELWKRQGLFFENMAKYKAIPSEVDLLERAKKAADQLRSLEKIFSQNLKGVKLANGVAKELEDWTKVAAPTLHAASKGKEEEEKAAAEKAAKKDAQKEDEEKTKKDKKLSKKEKKLEKKAKKAEKKAKKTLAKIEKATKEAEQAAQAAAAEQDQAKQRIDEIEKEIEETEARAREAAAAEEEEAEADAAEAAEKVAQLREQLDQAYDQSAEVTEKFLSTAGEAKLPEQKTKKRKRSSSSEESSDD